MTFDELKDSLKRTNAMHFPFARVIDGRVKIMGDIVFRGSRSGDVHGFAVPDGIQVDYHKAVSMPEAVLRAVWDDEESRTDLFGKAMDEAVLMAAHTDHTQGGPESK